MKYIFSYKSYNGKEWETVKTVGEYFTDLKNWNTYTYSTENDTITHNFRVYFKYKEFINEDNEYCTYYYIDNHTKEIDKTTAINNKLQEQSQAIENNTNAIEEIILTLLNEN